MKSQSNNEKNVIDIQKLSAEDRESMIQFIKSHDFQINKNASSNGNACEIVIKISNVAKTQLNNTKQCLKSESNHSSQKLTKQLSGSKKLNQTDDKSQLPPKINKPSIKQDQSSQQQQQQQLQQQQQQQLISSSHSLSQLNNSGTFRGKVTQHIQGIQNMNQNQDKSKQSKKQENDPKCQTPKSLKQPSVSDQFQINILDCSNQKPNQEVNAIHSLGIKNRNSSSQSLQNQTNNPQNLNMLINQKRDEILHSMTDSKKIAKPKIPPKNHSTKMVGTHPLSIEQQPNQYLSPKNQLQPPKRKKPSPSPNQVNSKTKNQQSNKNSQSKSSFPEILEILTNRSQKNYQCSSNNLNYAPAERLNSQQIDNEATPKPFSPDSQKNSPSSSKKKEKKLSTPKDQIKKSPNFVSSPKQFQQDERISPQKQKNQSAARAVKKSKLYSNDVYQKFHFQNNLLKDEEEIQLQKFIQDLKSSQSIQSIQSRSSISKSQTNISLKSELTSQALLDKKNQMLNMPHQLIKNYQTASKPYSIASAEQAQIILNQVLEDQQNVSQEAQGSEYNPGIKLYQASNRCATLHNKNKKKSQSPYQQVMERQLLQEEFKRQQMSSYSPKVHGKSRIASYLFKIQQKTDEINKKLEDTIKKKSEGKKQQQQQSAQDEPKSKSKSKSRSSDKDKNQNRKSSKDDQSHKSSDQSKKKNNSEPSNSSSLERDKKNNSKTHSANEIGQGQLLKESDEEPNSVLSQKSYLSRNRSPSTKSLKRSLSLHSERGILKNMPKLQTELVKFKDDIIKVSDVINTTPKQVNRANLESLYNQRIFKEGDAHQIRQIEESHMYTRSSQQKRQQQRKEFELKKQLDEIDFRNYIMASYDVVRNRIKTDHEKIDKIIQDLNILKYGFPTAINCIHEQDEELDSEHQNINQFKGSFDENKLSESNSKYQQLCSQDLMYYYDYLLKNARLVFNDTLRRKIY